eukprot:1181849-Lingulodinium_polyedra.AAC.1
MQPEEYRDGGGSDKMAMQTLSFSPPNQASTFAWEIMASFACVALWPLPICPLLGLERVRMPSRTGI